MIPLYEVPRVVKFLESESTMMVARAGGGENEEFLCNGYRVSFWEAEKTSRDGQWLVAQYECI